MATRNDLRLAPVTGAGPTSPVAVDQRSNLLGFGGQRLGTPIDVGVIGGLTFRRRATMHDVYNAATPEAALNAMSAFAAGSGDPAAAATGTAFQSIVFVDPAVGSGGSGTLQSPLNAIPYVSGNRIPANTAVLVKGGSTIARDAMIVIDGAATGQTQPDGTAERVANAYLGSYFADQGGPAIFDFSNVIPDATSSAETSVRGMRIAAQNVTLADIEIRPPNATSGPRTGGGSTTIVQQSAFTVDQASAGFVAKGLRLNRPVDVNVKNIGMALNGCSHFIIEDCESVGFWMNPIASGSVNQTLLDAESRVSRIRRNILRCGTMQQNLYFDGDCLTLGGTVLTNWNYKLVISDNLLPDTRENCVDLGAHGQVIVYRNYMQDPVAENNPGVLPCAIICGTSNANLAVRPSGNIVIGNIIRGFNREGYAAVNSRGGRRLFLVGNIIDDCWRAIGNTTDNTPDVFVLHNTMVRIGAGSVFRNPLAGNTGWRVMNNIMHGSRIWNLSSTTGAGGLRGGNLLCGGDSSDRNLVGTTSGVPWVIGAQHSPDHWFTSLSGMVDPVTLEPTFAAAQKRIAPLTVPVLDALLSSYRWPCAGALAPAEWR